jgi:hypothetical protein
LRRINKIKFALQKRFGKSVPIGRFGKIPSQKETVLLVDNIYERLWCMNIGEGKA